MGAETLCVFAWRTTVPRRSEKIGWIGREAAVLPDGGIPIAAVNLGRTRADDLLALKVEDRCERALSFLL
jgi:hypothetical protein